MLMSGNNVNAVFSNQSLVTTIGQFMPAADNCLLARVNLRLAHCIRQVYHWKYWGRRQGNPKYIYVLENSYMKAVYCKESAQLQRLLWAEIDPTAIFGSEVLTVACELGNKEYVRLLLNDGRSSPVGNLCDYDKYVIPLVAACEYGSIEVFDILMEDNRVDLAIHGFNMFYTACENNRDKLVSYMLAIEEIDPTAHGCDAFSVACMHENTKLVQILLDDGRVNPEVGLRAAREFDNAKCIEYIERHVLATAEAEAKAEAKASAETVT